MVEVIAGNARGARGRVLRAMPRQRRLVIEGVNMVWKHMKRSQQRPRGERIEIEAPIDISNVQLICPNRECPRYDKGVRIRRVTDENNRRRRVCARCGAEIPRAQ